MTTRALAAWLVLSAGGWPGPLLAGADADDDAEPLRRAPAQLSLTSSQEQAVGIRVEQPLALRSAPQIEAYGTVLDPVALANDMGRVQTTRVAAAAAEAEATRLEHLYRDDAQVSLKASQAAQAQAAEASAQARAAALVYAEKGSYVYRRHRTSSAAGFHYEAVPVRPLSRVGSAWLVEGLAPDDQVVVQGAGVLWSLQGVGSFSAAEEEHD